MPPAHRPISRTDNPSVAAASGEAPCDLHGHRIAALEERCERHSDLFRKLDAQHLAVREELGAGKVEFAELRKDIAALRESVEKLNAAARWAVAGVIGAVGLAIINLVLKH